ncbi:MAG TPA: hypothetical protein DIT03_09065, partial [Candidatus Accumulibacter sp.]|nr:hypothetical protein [Accumulibacter sp.]
MADSKTIKLALAIAALVAAPAAFAYNDSSAQGDCVGKVAGWGTSYSHAHDVRVDATVYKSYN